MSATRSFRLGYSIITWGGTPDLDQALGAIAGAGWEGAEFTGTSLESTAYTECADRGVSRVSLRRKK
jgi:hypothetical protein